VQKVKWHLKAIPDVMVKEVLTIKFKNANIHVSDSWKEVPRWEDFLGWLKADSLSKMRWIETSWDCDSFALESKCRAERRIVGNISYGLVLYEPRHIESVVVGYTDGVLKAMQVRPRSGAISNNLDEAYLVVM